MSEEARHALYSLHPRDDRLTELSPCLFATPGRLKLLHLRGNQLASLPGVSSKAPARFDQLPTR